MVPVAVEVSAARGRSVRGAPGRGEPTQIAELFHQRRWVTAAPRHLKDPVQGELGKGLIQGSQVLLPPHADGVRLEEFPDVVLLSFESNFGLGGVGGMLGWVIGGAEPLGGRGPPQDLRPLQ